LPTQQQRLVIGTDFQSGMFCSRPTRRGRIAVNIAKQSEYCKGQKANESTFDPILF
jgi:hypothetical protein